MCGAATINRESTALTRRPAWFRLPTVVTEYRIISTSEWNGEQMSTARDPRGQVEGVGVVLLTAVIVVVISTFGAFYLGSIGDEESVTVDLDVRLTPTELTVTHGGGTAMATDDVVVLVRHENGTESRYPLADGTLTGSTPGTFDPGETWTRSIDVDAGDRPRVLVVHNASESVPFNSPVTVQERETATLAPT